MCRGFELRMSGTRKRRPATPVRACGASRASARTFLGCRVPRRCTSPSTCTSTPSGDEACCSSSSTPIGRFEPASPSCYVAAVVRGVALMPRGSIARQVLFDLTAQSYPNILAKILCSSQLCGSESTLASHAVSFDTYYTFEATVNLVSNTMVWTLSQVCPPPSARRPHPPLPSYVCIFTVLSSHIAILTARLRLESRCRARCSL
jgi:hypothetical protein